MIKKITKIGNSQGILLDATTMDMAHLKVGDTVNLEIHEGGTITIMPLDNTASSEKFTETLRGVVKDYRKTLRKLS